MVARGLYQLTDRDTLRLAVHWRCLANGPERDSPRPESVGGARGESVVLVFGRERR